MAAKRRLSTKQRVFVEEYLICWNATEAARRAGYKHPNVQGPRLLVNVSIQAAIQARVDEIAMSANEALLRLTEQARGDISDFIVISKEGQARIDLKKARAARKLHLVKKISETKHGLKIELYDAQAAIQLIGRHRGMFVDKTALTDPTGELPWNPFAGMTNDEVDDEIRRMEQRGERALPPAEEGATAEGSAGTAGEDPGGEEADA
jgi:phage terminase small subunit